MSLSRVIFVGSTLESRTLSSWSRFSCDDVCATFAVSSDSHSPRRRFPVLVEPLASSETISRERGDCTIIFFCAGAVVNFQIGREGEREKGNRRATMRKLR